jgi:hypothetical protein
MTHEIDTRLRALERAVVELLTDRLIQETRHPNTTTQGAAWWGEARDAVWAAMPTFDAAPAEPTPAAPSETGGDLRGEIARLREQVATLTRERDEATRDYENACRLVAKMHHAATGEVAGPRYGVVEDVADLRTRAERAEAEVARLRALCGDAARYLAPAVGQPTVQLRARLTAAARGEVANG